LPQDLKGDSKPVTATFMVEELFIIANVAVFHELQHMEIYIWLFSD
jgi:hypothetical protein